MTEKKQPLEQSEMPEKTQPLEQDLPQDPGDPKKFKKKTSLAREFQKLKRIHKLGSTDESLSGTGNSIGYTPERMAEAGQLAVKVDDLVGDQKATKSTQLKASRAFKLQFKKADGMTTLIVRTSRLAFEGNPDMIQALGLKGRRNLTLGDWLPQNKHLIKGLLGIPGALEQIGKFNTTQEDIETALQEVLLTEDLDRAHEKTKAEAQEATELKNKAYKEFYDWMTRYIKFMELALEDRPQMKEKLGIVTPSEV